MIAQDSSCSAKALSEKISSPLSHFSIYLYFCRVVRSDARTGGRWVTKHLKGVESTSYLRDTESCKFNNYPHGKAVFQCPLVVNAL